MRAGLAKLGCAVSLKDAQRMVDEADEDGNGTVELDEALHSAHLTVTRSC